MYIEIHIDCTKNKQPEGFTSIQLVHPDNYQRPDDLSARGKEPEVHYLFGINSIKNNTDI